MSETVEPPAELPPARRGGKVALLGVCASVVAFAGIAGIAGIAINHSTTTATMVSPQGGPAVYPLIAHWEEVNDEQAAVCDPSSVTAYSFGPSTVSIAVKLGAPGRVEVWIDGLELNGLPIHLSQQVTKRGTGAEFTTVVADPGRWARVLATDRHNTGVCSVLPKHW